MTSCDEEHAEYDGPEKDTILDLFLKTLSDYLLMVNTAWVSIEGFYVNKMISEGSPVQQNR